nr:cardiomyopathy-associated protein 5 [Nothobranchius furzeri]
MEECESLDSEVTEQELQSEASDVLSQDDEDEVEELTNSLREVVQDQSVKPKLQCLMVDPSFSMVTVQSEDSGIVWETASSRCSTPWASETSSTSEAYSMEGSGSAGKITIVFDEEKVVRRRTRSGGRISRLGDQLSRPGSSRSASALGVERLEMMEVSVPNVKQEEKQTEADLEEIKNKDQQLFSLISEGYEILNIRVPSKLPTVDEEETTELQDNLFYLDQTPKIRSQNHHDMAEQWDLEHSGGEEAHTDTSDQEASQPPPDKEFGHTPSQRDSTCDFDYFEKFSLYDVVVSGEQAPQLSEEEEKPLVISHTEEQKPSKDAAKDIPSVPEESFVLVTDVEIVGEHLDEVFYGEGPPVQRAEEEGEERMRTRRESQRSLKGSGSVLFTSEETTLTPIFISPGPPKIIDPILLEEPTAMSFMYSDLYEDAVGERMRSDEEYSEAESVASEKSCKRRFSDSEEADGYLEKFTLKDETPAEDVQSESLEDGGEGRMVWPQNKFEMTGCLMKAPQAEEEEKSEGRVGGGSYCEKKTETQSSVVIPEQAGRETPQDSNKEAESVKDWMKTQQEQHEVDQTEPETDETLQSQHMKTKDEETQEGEEHKNIRADTKEPGVIQKPSKELLVITDVTAEPPAELPASTESEASLSSEAAVESKMEDEASSPERESDNVMTEALTETEMAAETPQCGSKEPLSEDGFELVTDCDCEVQTVVEVMEKQENKEESHVRIELQDVTDAETGASEAARQQERPTEESFIAKTSASDLESEVTSEILSEVIQPPALEEVKTESDEKQMQQEMDRDSEEAKQQTTSHTPAGDSGTVVQDCVSVGDEFILLVPKGQAVEMDIKIDQWTDITKDAVPPTEPEAQNQKEAEIKEEIPRYYYDEEDLPSAPVEEASTEESKIEKDLVEDQVVLSPLRSFSPLEDLSGLRGDDEQTEEVEAEQQEVIHKADDAPEADIFQDNAEPSVDVCSKEKEVVLDVQEETVDELGYEVISEQEAQDLPQCEIRINAEEERTEMEAERGQREESFSENELIQAGYEIIDEEEESKARLAAELQGLDWFCVTCERLLSEDERMSEEHRGHKVNLVDKAYEEIKETLSVWISELQERSENIEDLVSELELAYNSVEDQFKEQEEAIRVQNEEMMAQVMEQYNQMSITMEEEKKAKLEQLYDKIVSFQENIDSAKTTLETTAREDETDARPPEDIHARLTAALDSVLCLELGAKGLLVFEDYTKTNTSSSSLAQRKGIPAPQKPTLQTQEPGSGTSTSVTVYWKVNSGDIIDCFQVYCMEDPQGAVSEEYRVTVKESYCVLEELEPDKTYKVWVMAVNYTGCSLPSDKLIFRTAPSVPAIDTERCTVMWDSATLRWSSTKQSPEQSYTLEYCRQYELEGEGLRSISGISVCEQKVLLQPNENYLFYIRAVNEAGSSEQSEAALISTKGTRFRLLKASAHPALMLSDDQTTLHYPQEAHKTTDKEHPSILGELLPSRGLHYWETVVSGSTAYRLGVTTNRNSALGETSTSWCLQCTPSPSGCRYQLLHNHIQSTVFVTKVPERVGTLLDYQLGRLSFYSVHSGQLLGTFRQWFAQSCHPVLALEQPGSLQVCMVQEAPEFTKDS